MGIRKSLFKCQCGCNEDIPYSPRHEFPSRKPKFKAGHAHRNKFSLNRNTIEMEYLAIGSGVKLAEKHGISPVAVYNMLNKLNVDLLPKDQLDEHNQKMGRQWELVCIGKLKGAIDCSREDWRSPYDIVWNGYKINVKASHPVYTGENKERKAWSFRTKADIEVDVFLCIGLNEKGSIEKIFWIPASEAKKQTTIQRNGNTKYEKYRTSFEDLNHERQNNGY